MYTRLSARYTVVIRGVVNLLRFLWAIPAKQFSSARYSAIITARFERLGTVLRSEDVHQRRVQCLHIEAHFRAYYGDRYVDAEALAVLQFSNYVNYFREMTC